MNRRELTKLLGTGLLASAITPRIGFAAAAAPQVAITMDDFNLFGADEQTAEKRNQAILSALRAHSIKAAIFVCGKAIDSPLGQRLLKQWNDAGHIIANHTYSHRNYANSDFRQYSADILRCEALIKNYRAIPSAVPLSISERRRYRRAPRSDAHLPGGARIQEWCRHHRCLRLVHRRSTAKAAQHRSKANTTGYRDYYLQHIADRSTYYNDLSGRALGRSVKHTLLVHHNLVNELFLGDILDQYKRLGWKLIDAEDAYTDPIFNEKPDVLPAGDSLVLALALQSGKTKLPRYPPEDGVYEAPNMDRLGL